MRPGLVVLVSTAPALVGVWKAGAVGVGVRVARCWVLRDRASCLALVVRGRVSGALWSGACGSGRCVAGWCLWWPVVG